MFLCGKTSASNERRPLRDSTACTRLRNLSKRPSVEFTAPRSFPCGIDKGSMFPEEIAIAREFSHLNVRVKCPQRAARHDLPRPTLERHKQGYAEKAKILSTNWIRMFHHEIGILKVVMAIAMIRPNHLGVTCLGQVRGRAGR